MKLETIAELVGKRIRELRERRGLTQEDFNEGEGPINERSLRRIESGELPNTELLTLLRICERLGVHPRELFEIDVPWEIRALPEEKPKRKRKRRP